MQTLRFAAVFASLFSTFLVEAHAPWITKPLKLALKDVAKSQVFPVSVVEQMSNEVMNILDGGLYNMDAVSRVSSKAFELGWAAKAVGSRNAGAQHDWGPGRYCAPFDPEDCIIQSVSYLFKYLPERDYDLDVSYFVVNIALAIAARKQFPWSQATPWPLFLNEVLPYASLTEPRDDWRLLFYVFMSPLVAGMTSATDAALHLNKLAYTIVDPPIVYSPSITPGGINNYSPFETMAAHTASCTGLSVFLVDALRSVGIPARIAGTPHWNLGPETCPHGDHDAACGNHSWVEVWADGGWHFIESADVGGLDEGWFYPGWTQYAEPLSGSHAIYASSWAPSGQLDPELYPGSYVVEYFPLVWEEGVQEVPAWDVTQRYTA